MRNRLTHTAINSVNTGPVISYCTFKFIFNMFLPHTERTKFTQHNLLIIIHSLMKIHAVKIIENTALDYCDDR